MSPICSLIIAMFGACVSSQGVVYGSYDREVSPDLWWVTKSRGGF